MRVLCVESEPGVAAAAVDQLEAGGHEVVRCYEEGAGRTAPCVGLDRPGSCPLDDPRGVDVVLDVRSGEQAMPTLREQGVTCALRQGVPLAVSGRVEPNPFARWTAAVADPADVAGACAVAAQRALDELGAQVTRAVCRWLDGGYVPGVDVDTDVAHHGDRLELVIHRPPPEAARDVAVAVRAHRAVRDAGVTVSAISISCVD
jgi:hypothetical protein